VTAPVEACLVNGEAAIHVAAADRGISYGDGVFETLAVVDHQPQLWGPHLQRLARGCRRLGFDPPDEALWRCDVEALNLPRFAVLRLSATRGIGGRGYAPPIHPQPTRIMRCLPAPARPEAAWTEGVTVRFCDTRLAVQPALAGIKHLNRLEQVLARREWETPAIAEGLMESTRGTVIEATACNLIVDRGDRLVVPDTRECGVDGVMQHWLLERARQKGACVERCAVTRRDLFDAHGVMLTNSLIGLWPVRAIAAEPLSVTPWAQYLQDEVDAHRMALTPGIRPS
jgi:4-amino-4-deoxychorismate lyase